MGPIVDRTKEGVISCQRVSDLTKEGREISQDLLDIENNDPKDRKKYFKCRSMY